MSKTKREFDDLLSKYFELEIESYGILSKFDELISDPSRIGNSQRCDEMKDKFDKNLLKSIYILDKLDDLVETFELNDLRAFEIIMRDRRDELLERKDEMDDNLLKIIIKQADEKLQKLLEIEEEIKRADKKEEIKQADEKLQKLIGKKEETKKPRGRKETRKSNSKIKTAVYLGYVIAATLIYLKN